MSKDSDSGNYTKGFIMGAIIGGAVGAITALLLAPKSGAELRKEIANTSSDIYDKATDYFTQMESSIGNVVNATVNEGRQRAQNIINSARNQAETILESAEQVLKDARSKASNAKDQVQDKIEHIRNAAKASADTFHQEMSSSKEG